MPKKIQRRNRIPSTDYLTIEKEENTESVDKRNLFIKQKPNNKIKNNYTVKEQNIYTKNPNEYAFSDEDNDEEDIIVKRKDRVERTLDAIPIKRLCAQFCSIVAAFVIVSLGAIFLFGGKGYFHWSYVPEETNYYSVLGLEPTATSKEIRDQYKKLALKFHPDRNPNCKDCSQKFIKIAEAYSKLTGQEETVVKIAPDRWEDYRRGKERRS
ncbi:putative chaperone DnaJ domain protein [Monocercomonoides exilis]|uniref:putative chaperone DnaJ domain protein n=1 Tax=Monocercomonoides exilis TaxID=2049356 RepID=UPI00355A8200|nr:putative chaperone DnaJ domain protein [Monocercomonoides exilis]|eukprot:MONOS_14515.1-p1 / transcript=MONOS_14515.1 / gene=MONOS_14515 / organism=Monocercomonoides_exilis_PA203 / gene_product=chaperone DnaJ domain protein / transcript_product=chaperone DnaJ domain protein / location=Mono_scaffold01016:9009-9795(+) / protein_length=211 / sequence_SO=supercontig / SO=protein_coding / is_pseudo=false